MLFYIIYTNLGFSAKSLHYIYFVDIIYAVYILAKSKHLGYYSIHTGWIPLRKGRYIHLVDIHSDLNPELSRNMHSTRKFNLTWRIVM